MSAVGLKIIEGGASSPDEDAMRPEDIIADYLDYLCAPLVGVVPYRERTRLREETGYHLDSLMNTFILEGLPPLDAAYRAVHKYGESHQVGQQFIEAWFAHQPQGPLSRSIGIANLRAVTFFGAATFVVTILIQVRAYQPLSGQFVTGPSQLPLYSLPLTHLPILDGSPLSIATIAVTVLAPFVAGVLTGISVPVSPARAVYQVQILLTLYTFVLGTLMLPTSDGILLALVQLFLWLPIGCLSANIASIVTWRHRCRYRADTP